MHTIKSIHAREILDSRGYPTIEVSIKLANGVTGIAAVPSGASVGSKEALELRDLDLNRYMGKGVLNAINNINTKIQPVLLNQSINQQLYIDNLLKELDGTNNKSNLGANAILAVSLAIARAGANYYKLELYEYLNYLFINSQYSAEYKHIFNPIDFKFPLPLINIINGGVHADNNLKIQEFMIVPVKTGNIREKIRWSVEVFYCLKSILRQYNLSTLLGDEGGFAPDLRAPEEAMEYIILAIEKAGFKLGDDFGLALDCAANEFRIDGGYILDKQKLTSEQFIAKLVNWVDSYKIISIEDGLAEDDFYGWEELTNSLGNKIQLVGDDLFVSNAKILDLILKNYAKIANAILIKPNQIGTLSETFDTIRLAKKNDYNYIISHRSGETEDSFIADLSVATAAKQIKTGSVSRSERIVKYNRLFNIEEMITKN